MSDTAVPDQSAIEALEQDIASAILRAGDEAALEQVRVSALGKKGSVSELLKSLGAMSPDERKVMGPAINGRNSPRSTTPSTSTSPAGNTKAVAAPSRASTSADGRAGAFSMWAAPPAFS